MSWVEKSQLTPFDDLPIYGLQFLDGAILARWFEVKYDAVETPFFHPDWLKNQKRPQVVFPSGLTFDLGESNPENGGIVHLFGEMDLPYFDTRDRAWELANDIAEQVGYRARKRGESQLEVMGHDAGEHFLITYETQERRIADIQVLRTSQRETQAQAQQGFLLGGGCARVVSYATFCPVRCHRHIPRGEGALCLNGIAAHCAPGLT